MRFSIAASLVLVAAVLAACDPPSPASMTATASWREERTALIEAQLFARSRQPTRSAGELLLELVELEPVRGSDVAGAASLGCSASAPIDLAGVSADGRLSATFALPDECRTPSAGRTAYGRLTYRDGDRFSIQTVVGAPEPLGGDGRTPNEAANQSAADAEEAAAVERLAPLRAELDEIAALATALDAGAADAPRCEPHGERPVTTAPIVFESRLRAIDAARGSRVPTQHQLTGEEHRLSDLEDSSVRDLQTFFSGSLRRRPPWDAAALGARVRDLGSRFRVVRFGRVSMPRNEPGGGPRTYIAGSAVGMLFVVDRAAEGARVVCTAPFSVQQGEYEIRTAENTTSVVEQGFRISTGIALAEVSPADEVPAAD